MYITSQSLCTQPSNLTGHLIADVRHDLIKDLYFSNVPGQPAARKIISKTNTVISSAIRYFLLLNRAVRAFALGAVQKLGGICAASMPLKPYDGRFACRTDQDFFALDMRGAQEDAARELNLCEKVGEHPKCCS